MEFLFFKINNIEKFKCFKHFKRSIEKSKMKIDISMNHKVFQNFL